MRGTSHSASTKDDETVSNANKFLRVVVVNKSFALSLNLVGKFLMRLMPWTLHDGRGVKGLIGEPDKAVRLATFGSSDVTADDDAGDDECAKQML